MGVPAITVDLDEYQIERLATLRKQLTDAAEAGQPGMALAQIFFGAQEMKVFFVSHEQAHVFKRVMESPFGLTTETRIDR